MNGIELDNVRFSYGNGFVLETGSLNFGPGAIALCGPNGAGKTTLLKVAASLIKPQAGSVKLCGKDMHSYTKRGLAEMISYVPQVYDETFDFTAYEITAMGRRPYTNMLGALGSADRKMISRALEIFGIAHKAGKSFNALSGGEKRAVLIARAYAQEAKWVLMDEPSAFLDPGHIAMLGSCIRELTGSGRNVIMVTHDVDFAGRLCGRLVFVSGGRGAADVKTSGISSALITSVFGENVDFGRADTECLRIKY